MRTRPSKRLEIVYRATDSLRADPKNARTHSPEQIGQLRASLRKFGFTNPILLRPNGMIGAGHGRWEMAKAEGLAEVPTITLAGLTEPQWRAYMIADNKLALNAGWDFDLLRAELGAIKDLGFDLGDLGFSGLELGEIGVPGFGDSTADAARPTVSLSERFGAVPFSVLNAREGWWQDRKRAWLALGIQSEIGRGENLLKMSDTVLEPDPVKRAALVANRTEPGNARGNRAKRGHDLEA